jgi:hypothetical protein
MRDPEPHSQSHAYWTYARRSSIHCHLLLSGAHRPPDESSNPEWQILALRQIRVAAGGFADGGENAIGRAIPLSLREWRRAKDNDGGSLFVLFIGLRWIIFAIIKMKS